MSLVSFMVTSINQHFHFETNGNADFSMLCDHKGTSKDSYLMFPYIRIIRLLNIRGRKDENRYDGVCGGISVGAGLDERKNSGYFTPQHHDTRRGNSL